MDPSLRDIIYRLLEAAKPYLQKPVRISESEARQLCIASREIFLQQPCLLELEAPIKIVGDIHGHYAHLLKLFRCIGYPPETSYLFLGNYVDYGNQSFETICLLLAYKIKYPENFFLLRGNHECALLASRYHGYRLYDECKQRFNVRLWEEFIDCFNCLPVAALIGDKIFCTHGGLSPDLNSLNQIRLIQRPTDVPDSGLLCDLLWSDPSWDIKGWGMNNRGVSYTFGPEVVTRFLHKHNLELICCSNRATLEHKDVEDGYEFFADRQLVTLFSAPNYRDFGQEFDNLGAIMSVDECLMCSFQILRIHGYLFRYIFEVAPINKPAERMNNSGSTSGVKPSGSTVAAKFRSNSPGLKHDESTNKPNSGSDNAASNSENPPPINLVEFNFDPNSLYRSKSPGVKRFLGARV